MSLDELRSPAFRDILGFPGYRVGDDGSVWSCWTKQGRGIGRGTRYVQTQLWKELAGGTDKDGYRKVILCNRKKKRYVRVNVLVLEVFTSPRPVGEVAAHQNGIRADNRLSNLQWKTQRSNIADKKRHGTHQQGNLHGCSRVTEDDVREIRRRRVAGETYALIAEDYPIGLQGVAAICSRRNWKCVA
ncbi:hypothetical protein LCGC14_1857280 [marine sediment metagenome]|uniref:Uncharacterized protein n=1 Tax=marine sediment metagenome TaxID=412755 RepID=A0A0F9J7N4_9ZZZZ